MIGSRSYFPVILMLWDSERVTSSPSLSVCCEGNRDSQGLPLLSVGSGPQRGSEVMMRCCALTARTGAGCPRLFTGQDAGCLKLGAGWSQEEEKEVWTSTPVDQTTFHHVEAADV